MMKCLSDNCTEEMTSFETGKVFGLKEEGMIPEIIIPFPVTIQTCNTCHHSFIIPKVVSRIVTPDEPKIITL